MKKYTYSLLLILALIVGIYNSNGIKAAYFSDSTIAHLRLGPAGTKFSVYVKSGERISFKSEINSHGSLDMFYDSDPNPIDYDDLDGDGKFNPAKDNLNDCNITKTPVVDDGSHTYYFEVTDSNGNVIVSQKPETSIDVTDANSTISFTTNPITQEGIYTVSFYGNSSWTRASGQYYDFDMSTCSGITGVPSMYADDPLAKLDWDINVVDNATNVIAGRVWTNELILVQLDNDLFTGDLYTVSDAGYIYKLTMYDYQGWASTIRFSSIGLADGNGAPINKSVWIHKNNPQVSSAGLYKLFFEKPATDLPTTIVSQPIDQAGVDLGKIFNFKQSEDGYNNVFNTKKGSIYYYLAPEFVGPYDIIIDANSNGTYTDSEDVKISLVASGGLANGSVANPISVEWDGLDGKGKPVAVNVELNARINIDNISSIYFTFSDVEQLGGIKAVQLNGTNVGNSTLYWDDSGYSGDVIEKQWSEFRATKDNTTTMVTHTSSLLNGNYPLDNTAGIDSNVPGGVHGWLLYVVSPTNWDTTWGNVRVIESWMEGGIDINAQIKTTGKLKIDEIKHNVYTQVLNGYISGNALVDHKSDHEVTFKGFVGTQLKAISIDNNNVDAKYIDKINCGTQKSNVKITNIVKDTNVKVEYDKNAKPCSISQLISSGLGTTVINASNGSVSNVPETGQYYLTYILPLMAVTTTITYFMTRRQKARK